MMLKVLATAENSRAISQDLRACSDSSMLRLRLSQETSFSRAGQDAPPCIREHSGPRMFKAASAKSFDSDEAMGAFSPRGTASASCSRLPSSCAAFLAQESRHSRITLSTGGERSASHQRFSQAHWELRRERPVGFSPSPVQFNGSEDTRPRRAPCAQFSWPKWEMSTQAGGLQEIIGCQQGY
jgi:hypothetical protein